MLIAIALLDITIGGAAIGIGVTAYLKMHLHPSLISYVILNSISFVLSVACLIAIHTKNLRLLKYYYLWKCFEVVAIPIFEIILFTVSIGSQTFLSEMPAINYYIIVLLKAGIRLYFAFLIFSYYMRIDRGEALLVEYGVKRLDKIINEIKSE